MADSPSLRKKSNVDTEQYLQNWSFDEDFGVLAFELLGFDSVNNVMKRITTDALSHFGTNDVDKSSSTLFYEGLEDAGGTWQIVKISISGNITSNRFATKTNNPSNTSYSDAWTNRATLTYGTYSQAF